MPYYHYFFLCLCLLLSNLHIPKFVLETQIPYIRSLLQFFYWVVAPKNWKEVFGGEREFLTANKGYITEDMLFFHELGILTPPLPLFPSRFPLFSLSSYLGGCKINRWYFPHLDFHFFSYLGRCEITACYPPNLL